MVNISFFSYKGGAGRTSLLFNVLPFLAEKLHATVQEPIIVLDLDLDSKGLSYLINDNSKINSIQVLRGDSSIGFSNGGNINTHPFFSSLTAIGAKVGLPSDLDRSILCVTAHGIDGAMSLSEGNNYDGRNISLSTLNKLCNKYNCKAIVMDTPAGNQISGTCALSISKKIVTVMRITQQFRKGTAEFLRVKSKDGEYIGKEYIIVPNAVPDTEGTTYRMDSILENIKNTVQSVVGKNDRLNLTFLENGRKGINEVTLFKFREENLLKLSELRPLSSDEQQAVDMYKLLAGELTDDHS